MKFKQLMFGTVMAISSISFVSCFDSHKSETKHNDIINQPNISAVTEIGSGQYEEDDSSYLDIELTENEKAEIRKTAEQAIKALQAQNYSDMIKYIDFEVWYYQSYKKSAADEEMTKAIQNGIENNANGFNIWSIPKDYEYTFGEVAPVSKDKVFLKDKRIGIIFDEDTYNHFDVSAVYKVEIIETVDGESEKGEMYVLRIDGKLKSDYAFSMDKDYTEDIIKRIEEQMQNDS